MKKTEKNGFSAEIAADASSEIEGNSFFSKNFWMAGTGVVVAIAAFLRFFMIELKPLHHDEGVNGHFLITLFRDNVYKYDPSNYHGPTLYFNTLAFAKSFGLETYSIRWSVAIWGVLMVLMACFLRRYIGRIGSLAAALMLALSPGMVFISRYFIHEIIFVCLSLGIVLGILYFIEGRPAGSLATAAMAILLLTCFAFIPFTLPIEFGIESFSIKLIFFIFEGLLVFGLMWLLLQWDDGRPIYLMLASACASLFFATKETAFITLGTMLIALGCVWLWRKFYVLFMGEVKDDMPDGLTFGNFLQNAGSPANRALLAISVIAVFSVVFIVFFTSFFTYSEGIGKAFEAYAFWTKTGNSDHTQNGYLGYAKWMLKIESPILVISAIGTLLAFLKGNNRFALFAGLWAFGLAAAYSIIPYKTPWLLLSFSLPMAIIGGYGINEMLTHKNGLAKAFGGLLMIGAVGVLGYQTIELNFYKYDDDTKPYVYAHTQRDFLKIIEKIEYYADKSGKGKDATIEIVSPEYWPMPWYMRDYEHANFHGRIVPANTAEFILASDGQAEETAREYSAHYVLIEAAPLRPGVDLELYLRKDLLDKK